MEISLISTTQILFYVNIYPECTDVFVAFENSPSLTIWAKGRRRKHGNGDRIIPTRFYVTGEIINILAHVEGCYIGSKITDIVSVVQVSLPEF
jgi:hypothetical protein